MSETIYLFTSEQAARTPTYAFVKFMYRITWAISYFHNTLFIWHVSKSDS